MAKFYEVTISGNYKTATRDIVEFEGIKGFMPYCEDEVMDMHCRARYAAKWVKETMGDDRDYKRINRMREIFIDDKVVVEKGKYSFVGKDIKKLLADELQDLATAKDLRRIPLPKLGDIRNTRVIAYVAYCEKIRDLKIKHQAEDFSFFKLPPIILDGELRKETEKKATNDEVLAAADALDATKKTKSALTMDELKILATQNGIKFMPSIGYDTLYAKIYGNK
ncbi:hypothetical protein KAR91_59790 [Candidatus Pacearchaeota archaeon]|nr:hypothetical protein [Candidatus Pacearchaeota archaeon]